MLWFKILASVRVKFQFLWHAALPKTYSSGQSQESGKSVFINQFQVTLNLSNFDLFCGNEKLPHAYLNDPCSMCSPKIPKRIRLFNGQIDTPMKSVTINVLIFRSCHGNTRNFMYRNFFDLVYLF